MEETQLKGIDVKTNKRNVVKAILGGFLTAAVSHSALAGDVKYPKVLLDAQKDGYFTIIDSVEMDEYPDTRAVLTHTSDGAYNMYWLNEKDQYITTGAFIQSNGINLTAKYTEMMKPSIKEAFNEVHKGGLVLGDDTSQVDDGVMYVFVEPYCGYCRRFHQELLPYIAGGLKVRYIPLAWIKANSADVVATIAKSNDVEKAISMAYTNQLPVTDKADDKIMAGLNKNSSVMKAIGLNGTPGVVYKNAKGKYVLTQGLSGENLEKLVNYLKSQSVKTTGA